MSAPGQRLPGSAHATGWTHGLRIGAIVAWTVACGLALHVFGEQDPAWMPIATSLLILPVLAASFYYGRVGGLAVSLAASFVTGLLAFRIGFAHGDPVLFDNLFFHTFYYNVVALVTSGLAESQKAARARYVSLIDGLPVGVFRLAPDGRLLEANGAMLRLLGGSPSQPLERFSAGMLSTDDGRPWWRGGEGEDQCDREVRLIRPGGAPLWARVQSRLVQEGIGGLTCYEGLITDISRRRTAEDLLRAAQQELEQRVEERTRELSEANRRLQELDAMKSRFMSSVSHELRTPLTAILGFTKLTRKIFEREFWPLASNDPRVNPQGRRILDNLDIIVGQSERLARLINDLLDLSKIESGTVVWRDEEHAVEALLQQAIRAVKGLLSLRPQLRLEMELDSHLPCVVMDADRFEQVVFNLVNNAVKFTPQGSVTIRARGLAGQLELVVADTGVGIPPDKLVSIFDKFQQVPTELDLPETMHGTGLGLTICREIVERYGGRIWAESEVGRGSRFIVRLPTTGAACGPANEASR